MKRAIIFFAALLVSVVSWSQTTQKVAILETVDREGAVPYGKRLQLRQSLTFAITNTPGYEGVDRVDMASITGEQNFQRTGMVSDEQIKKLGEMTGASLVLVAEAAIYDDENIIITAKLLDVETAGVKSAAPPEIASTDKQSMSDACISLARYLLKGKGALSQSSNSYTSTRSGGSTYAQQGGSTITIQVPGTNVSFEMIKVEAGSFIMGCTSEQGDCAGGFDSPCHRVTISNDYYIGKFEVTQELYEAVMRVNPSEWKSFDRPVEMVSWNDAQEFCAELSRLTGRRFSLPTEAEWEYAARGGKKSTSAKYSGSSSVAAVAWYDGNSGGQTHPVGKLRANELGIYDMSGNVSEWCYDWYGKYSSDSQTDPVGPGSGQYRVERGGEWNYYGEYCRVADRGMNPPDKRFSEIGFRVVLH